MTMADEQDKKVDFQIAVMLGTLSNQVEAIEKDIHEFKKDYDKGKAAAKEHAEWQKTQEKVTVKKYDIPNLLKIEWLIENRKFLLAVMGLLALLGLARFSQPFIDWMSGKVTSISVLEKTEKK